jgi:hypothetical protein
VEKHISMVQPHKLNITTVHPRKPNITMVHTTKNPTSPRCIQAKTQHHHGASTQKPNITMVHPPSPCASNNTMVHPTSSPWCIHHHHVHPTTPHGASNIVMCSYEATPMHTVVP